ncbi:uncharacterized protein LOC123559436 [Mercenaria mercenaria]|uniref:uncharacterized protein LOC123559436 n=1 Tax=Mercenaria mercenaria TaxID=6596 RepID=UPI00234F1D01|nr:uncharacterized protein LOC123559436 [Mercenaria mercenaria]XP_045207193.2 uncharacterized protein LOC123559436 [Mercenaria mercenaria]XP_045207194.2 uncharacterized protein LOC123559436 [Mercenaria mercenaria]XP_053408656.1 uncharacterized protein LOC123559436 [Mercenaria mercenaria]
MGQINSVQDAENGPQNGQMSQTEREENEIERELQREANSEQVRCVKTRIDMLIEDCLNTKDASSEVESERCRNKDVLNINHMLSKPGNVKRKENNSKSEKVSETETTEKVEGKNENPDTQKSDKNENADGSMKQGEKQEQVEDKNVAKKEEIKLSDIITDMVNTELSEKQLKNIQQRTITTFNTFIDKVLDSSLNQENNEEKPKPTNILKLCSESMIPEKGRKSEDSSNDSDRNEKPECDRDVVKPGQEKKITLKDHIERFLEMSFRDDNTKEENKSKKNSNVQENFNAQGLVNSMITQGLQINRLLTTKEQQHLLNQKTQKELEMQKKQMKYPEQNLRPKSHETYGQKSPNSNNAHDKTEVRFNHAVTGHQMVDAQFRDHYFSQAKYESVNRNSQIPTGYIRRDEMFEKNRELQAKMKVNASSKHEMGVPNNMRTSEHSSAFHPPHHLQVSNSAYYNPAYMPRMQMSPGQLRDMKNPMRGETKQVVHVRDCVCAMCVSQSHSRHGKIDPAGLDHHQGKRSPNVPHQLLASSMAAQVVPGHVREVPAMMRPSHSELPPGMVAYQGMHKLLPHHPPITSSKVYSGGQMMVPSEVTAQGMVPNRQPNMPENPHFLAHYPHRRGDEFSQNSANNERLAIRSGKQSPYHARPSSHPPHEHNSPHYARPGSGHPVYESDYSRNTDSSSCASDCSNEAPLDLTVKKSKLEPVRSRSSSNASADRRINPSNSFIKHLESSVDKYWQELNSPPSSPVNTKQPAFMNRAQNTPNDGRNVPHGYPQQSPNSSSPSGLLSMIQNRPLPSPHYSGGITVGQPLVDMKPPPAAQKQNEYSPQTGTQMVNKQAQQQPPFQGNQSNFDLNSKRSANNVSKHEPIQNIIGNHDPNDILYLICRLCTQTYGSPYGFRKHFRNQHGFEPRAEHTIVQTISATKSALHLPQPQLMQGIADIRDSHFMRKSISPESELINQKHVPNTYLGRKSSSESPVDSKSCTGSEGDKSELDNTETKCLECPECGKTFQLNDFGSYKRHCRQHGNIRMNGPFTCTDCHLPFPDQKSLREHYKVHVKDSAVVVSQEQKTEGTAQKLESHQTFYVCVKCDQQYDNVDIYKNHLTSHETESKTDADLQSVTNKQTTVSVKSENEMVTDIVSSKTVVKQAAESNTSLACPDSSWDNVAKVVATSDKPEVNLEISESTNSNMSNSSEKSNSNKEENKDNSQVILTPQKSVESGSENEKKGEENEFIYKHKKFFHHRKRASSSQSLSNDATDVKQAKISPDVPASVTLAVDNVTASSSTSAIVTPSCDSTGSSDTKVEETVDTNKGFSTKTAEKAPEKPAKTEARHSLPFVWDRTTRSQKKL